MAALVGRKVKLSRAGKSWKGCCPFHGEKSPSFYVYDDGYHCFGCGAHGDAIGFVMNTRAPASSTRWSAWPARPGWKCPSRRRSRRGGAAAAGPDRRAGPGRRQLPAQLHERGGRAALAYLRGRGLTDATIARFGLGWSGDGRGGLVGEMGRHDIEPARLVEAGLLQTRDDGALRELFYNRVMFPIRDRRGRTDQLRRPRPGRRQAEIHQRPGDPVYSKGRTLYALDLAREGARKPRRRDRGRGLHGRDRAAPGRLHWRRWRRSAPR